MEATGYDRKLPPRQVRCVSCTQALSLETQIKAMRKRKHKHPYCTYVRKWLPRLERGMASELADFRCSACVLWAAIMRGVQIRQLQLAEISTELAWTTVKNNFRVALNLSFESGELMMAYSESVKTRDKSHVALSDKKNVTYSVVVLNGPMIELITGTKHWEGLLKGSEWGEASEEPGESIGGASALRDALRQYSAATAQWAGGVAESWSAGGSGSVEWGVVTSLPYHPLSISAYLALWTRLPPLAGCDQGPRVYPPILSCGSEKAGCHSQRNRHSQNAIRQT